MALVSVVVGDIALVTPMLFMVCLVGVVSDMRPVASVESAGHVIPLAGIESVVALVVGSIHSGGGKVSS